MNERPLVVTKASENDSAASTAETEADSEAGDEVVVATDGDDSDGGGDEVDGDDSCDDEAGDGDETEVLGYGSATGEAVIRDVEGADPALL